MPDGCTTTLKVTNACRRDDRRRGRCLLVTLLPLGPSLGYLGLVSVFGLPGGLVLPRTLVLCHCHSGFGPKLGHSFGSRREPSVVESVLLATDQGSWLSVLLREK